MSWLQLFSITIGWLIYVILFFFTFMTYFNFYVRRPPILRSYSIRRGLSFWWSLILFGIVLAPIIDGLIFLEVIPYTPHWNKPFIIVVVAWTLASHRLLITEDGVMTLASVEQFETISEWKWSASDHRLELTVNKPACPTYYPTYSMNRSVKDEVVLWLRKKAAGGTSNSTGEDTEVQRLITVDYSPYSVSYLKFDLYKCLLASSRYLDRSELMSILKDLRNATPGSNPLENEFRSRQFMRKAAQILWDVQSPSKESEFADRFYRFIDWRNQKGRNNSIPPSVSRDEIERPCSILAVKLATLLNDSVLQGKSLGVLDHAGRPPCDWWLSLARSPANTVCLLCWIPEPVKPHIDEAIKANKSGCFSWLRINQETGIQLVGWGKTSLTEDGTI
ncbi:MAG: hypothetical protein KDA65_02005 [Planctomycetaceae bacterium]|nr:hypothetical protein [Planctomycetaceae bacterium]